MTDCNNHLHTLSKKKKFWISSFLAKIKGGKSHNAKNEQNFAPTEISGRKSGRRVQKSSGYIIRPHFIPYFKDFKFESKTKKLWSFKVSTLPKLQKHVCPPPFGSEPPFSTGFSWDDTMSFWKKNHHFLYKNVYKFWKKNDKKCLKNLNKCQKNAWKTLIKTRCFFLHQNVFPTFQYSV